VIVEGSDWVKVLESLKPAEDAAICFQRGTFETDRPVKLSGYGHITLSGAGGGTRIIARRSECALLFDSCESVTLHDLSISAPDGSGAIGQIAQRRGVVTVISCPEVDASGLALRCGGGAATERTCFTARGTDELPLRSVRVLHNRLEVGLAQDGILVTNCINTLISDNELSVVPGKAGLAPQRLFEDKVWRTRLVALLVGNPRLLPSKSQGSTRIVRAGAFVASFASSIPQDEWDKLIETFPPSASDRANANAFKGYVSRLVDETITQPERLPAYNRSLGALRTRIGDTRTVGLEREVKRSLIMATDPVIEAAGKIRAGGRAGLVTITAGAVSIGFTSPVSQADWNSALRFAPFTGIASELMLTRHVRCVANRMVADKRFRERLASSRTWFERFVHTAPTFGHQAIV